MAAELAKPIVLFTDREAFEQQAGKVIPIENYKIKGKAITDDDDDFKDTQSFLGGLPLRWCHHGTLTRAPNQTYIETNGCLKLETGANSNLCGFAFSYRPEYHHTPSTFRVRCKLRTHHETKETPVELEWTVHLTRRNNFFGVLMTPAREMAWLEITARQNTSGHLYDPIYVLVPNVAHADDKDDQTSAAATAAAANSAESKAMMTVDSVHSMFAKLQQTNQAILRQTVDNNKAIGELAEFVSETASAAPPK